MEISDEMIKAAQSAIRYLHHRDTPWSPEQVRAILETALAAREAEAGAVNPIGYLKPRAEWATTPHFVYADERAEDWQQQVFTIPVYASPPAPHVAEIPEGWRDISTAPKDGTDILVWKKGFRHPEIVRYELYHDADLEEEVGEPGFWRYSDDVIADIADASEEGFTHWMPLPAAPQHKQEGDST